MEVLIQDVRDTILANASLDPLGSNHSFLLAEAFDRLRSSVGAETIGWSEGVELRLIYEQCYLEWMALRDQDIEVRNRNNFDVGYEAFIRYLGARGIDRELLGTSPKAIVKNYLVARREERELA